MNERTYVMKQNIYVMNHNVNIGYDVNINVT